MKLTVTRTLVAIVGTTAAAFGLVAVHGVTTTKLGAVLHPALSYDAAAAPDSGPLHTLWIQCSGAKCLVGLARLRDLVDTYKGFAYLDDGGNLVSTPQGFTSNCTPIPGSVWGCPPPPAAATTHYLAPESNGTGAYRFAIFDRDWPLIAAIIAADAALLNAGLPAPAALAVAEDDAGSPPVEAGIEAGEP